MENRERTGGLQVGLVAVAAGVMLTCGGITAPSEKAADAAHSTGGSMAPSHDGGAAGAGGVRATGGTTAAAGAAPAVPPAICPGLAVSYVPWDRERFCTARALEDGLAPCEMQVPPPPGAELDLDVAGFWFQPLAGTLEEIPRIESPDACATSQHGGWYYVLDEDELWMRVCPCTCAYFGLEPDAAVTIALGCT